MDWTHGYIAELDYTHGIYRELFPAHLSFAALVKGVSSLPVDGEFTYCELGCGQGFTANMLAACHPNGRFYAADFNPAHIFGATELATTAGLTNITFLENSFDELLSLELPQFDFIVLHGIYSWVSAENRKVITEFIKARLKSGGLVYNSYNCLPGWSAPAPLRRLMTEYGAQAGGALNDRIEKSVTFLGKMKELNLGYFAANPSIAGRVEQITGASRNYLAHEYFNRDWHPLYHADVAAELAGAKLSFAASATPTDVLDFLSLNADAVKLLNEYADPLLRETIRDYLVNQVFRKDIYARGKVGLTLLEQKARLDEIPFALIVPRKDVKFKVKFPVGELNFNPTVYEPLLDELEKGRASMAQLMTSPRIAELGRDKLQQGIFILFGAGVISPAVDGMPEERGRSVASFNKAVLEKARKGFALNYLASPISCTAIAVDLTECLFILASLEDKDPVSHAWECLKSLGRVLVKDGNPLPTEEANLAELAVRKNTFDENRLPFLKYQGII